MWLLNLLLPGVGLVWRGRLWAGLLAISLIAVAVVTAGLGWALTVVDEPARQTVWLVTAALWAGAFLWSGVLWWLLERSGSVDEAVRNDCARSAQAALLRGEGDRALEHARRVVRSAPRLPAAWQLLAHCAAAAGKDRLARRAEGRAAWYAKQAYIDRA